jgi:hypothetical protein
MQNQMQLLLELLQYEIDLHFEDALADAVSAGVSVRTQKRDAGTNNRDCKWTSSK